MSKVSVAIADDNEIMLELLGDIVSDDDELEVVGTAKDGEEAYQLIKEKEPDVVLLDIVMELDKERKVNTMCNISGFFIVFL